MTDSLGAVTHYTHAQGLATGIADALGGVTQRVHNAHGELEIERDPLGAATLYDYNERGLVTQITRPDGASIQTSYNDLDLPAHSLDFNGGAWQWHYDEAGNLLEAHDPMGAVIRYRYANGLLVARIDATGYRTNLAYDTQHNLWRIVAVDGGTRTRQYDGLGRIVQLTDVAGAVQYRRYDLLAQLVAVREPDGLERTLRYNGEGNVVWASDGTHQVTFA